MKKGKAYVIGVSCIGSGVGQSVVTSCRLSGLSIRTVGFGTNAFAFGAYECDAFDYTPTIYADNFVEELIKKCIEHNVDLLIPGRDDETLIYSKNLDKFREAGIKTLAAGQEIIEVCRDKERMSSELNQIVDAFVKCYEAKELLNIIDTGEAEFPLIAKPRGGFASQGVEILLNKDDLRKVTDHHIVQELAVPLESDPNYSFFMNQIAKGINPQVSEISIQVVLGVNGELLGKMASFNKLNNGVPIEIVPFDSKVIWDVIDVLLPYFKKKGLIGPLNIQGRLTKRGLKLFEMNPRFTGITGLRALMGFNEVEACIKSWLSIGTNSKIEINSQKFGIRQTTDKSLAVALNNEVRSFVNQVNGDEIQRRKTLAITGAAGYLGQCLVEQFEEDDNVDLVLLGRDLAKLERIFPNSKIRKFPLGALEDGTLAMGNIDVFLHCAFARPHCSNTEIADSLAFTTNLFFRLAQNQVSAIINLSSQSVFGQEMEPLWTEETPVAPKIPYAQAKYATELVLAGLQKVYPHIKVTSLRLAALSGGRSGLQPVDFLSKLVLTALRGEDITLVGGEQQLEIMDVRDAARFIKAVSCSSPSSWHPVYNTGAGEIYSLRQIAECVIRTVKEETDASASKIIVAPGDANMKFGMDASLIMNSFNLTPKYEISEIIRSLIPYFQNIARI